ncbi:MAG: CocE/NonD family hydrolase, partial [Chloroflexi bacterium]|nr:CocE/NonD family hydrolase [Chloroflexota bacterium]
MFKRITVDYDVAMPMRDGIILRANIFRPDGDGDYPVALCRTPYDKNTGTSNPILDIPRLVRQGYIVVIQDVRGRFASPGLWHPFKHEYEDGYDTVQWCATLPGSTGQVGMFGASYLGFTQWATALTNPPALKAIVPSLTWSRADDGLFSRGGVGELGLIAYLATFGFGFDTLSKAFAPSQSGAAHAALVKTIDSLAGQGHEAIFATLKDIGLDRDLSDFFLRKATPAYATVLVDAEAFAKLEIPALNITGWYDVFLGGTLEIFERSQNSNHKLIVGPWSHINFDSVIGEAAYGLAASLGNMELKTDLTTLTQRWYDYWLKGIDNGIMDEPPVKFFVMGANEWRETSSFPPSGSKETFLYLRENNGLSFEPPADEA